MTRYQYCSACDARTGRCEEDSLYSPSDPEEDYPLCEECYDLATAAAIDQHVAEKETP